MKQVTRIAIAVSTILAASLIAVTAVPVLAQDFQWPWESQTKPVPREPVYRDDPNFRPPPVQRDDGGSAWGTTETYTPPRNICLELERRLVEQTRGGASARQQLPEIRQQMRETNRELAQNRADLEKGRCYEYFLFSKTLRNTRKCIALSKAVDKGRRQIAELEAQANRISNSSTQSRQSEIIRELARNQCGDSYVREARRRDYSPLSSLWSDNDSSDGYYGNDYNQLPFATYRTLCVRLCDGYYFPVSFSTLPNHFGRDADVCQSKCVAPSELYFHQNPGEGVEDMVAYSTKTRYTELKSAFQYRKEYVRGCSCKQTEYVPQTPGAAPVKKGSVDAPANTAQVPRPFSPQR